MPSDQGQTGFASFPSKITAGDFRKIIKNKYWHRTTTRKCICALTNQMLFALIYVFTQYILRRRFVRKNTLAWSRSITTRVRWICKLFLQRKLGRRNWTCERPENTTIERPGYNKFCFYLPRYFKTTERQSEFTINELANLCYILMFTDRIQGRQNPREYSWVKDSFQLWVATCNTSDGITD